MFVSYAQNFEDVMLWRALKGVENGFYIDIGAQDPVSDSVSKAFHDLGWRGVHVEPTADYAQRLREEREGDTVLQAIVGPATDQSVIYQIEGTGLSTTVAELARQHAGNNFKIEKRDVDSITLDELLDMHGDRELHWLKIDTEGSEAAVLASWQKSTVRPWIIVVESVDPLTHEVNSNEWEEQIFSMGYEFAYFDGVNKFYVSHRRKDLLKHFDRPPNLFDGFSLSGDASSPFANNLSKKNQALLAEQNQLSEQKAAIEETLRLERERIAEMVRQSDAERGRLHAQNEAQAEWWRQQLEARQRQIETLYKSTSWRVTAPLRMLARGHHAILPMLLRTPSIVVHRTARYFRRRFPGLFYRLATNRLARSLFEMFRKPLHSQSSSRLATSARPLTSGDSGQDTSETLQAMLSGVGRWKLDKRIDA